MAADVAEQVPRDHHASLSQSSVLDSTEPPPDEPTPIKAGDSAPVTIQVEPDVQGIPETESITMDAPLRSSIDISMEEARNRGVSASLTERTRTSSKNLFVKQESMTQLSTTVSTTTTDTATGSSDVFPEMTATNSADTPTTPPSDSDIPPSYPDPKPKKKPISKQETTTTRQSGTRPSVLAQIPPQQRSPDFVQREVYRKYRNQIRRTRKNHIILVSLVVYLGLALFGAAIALALASVALQKFHAPLSMPAILFGIIVVDCVLALVGELSLFVRMCYRVRNQADINPQLYFLFQLSRRPIVMGSLSVVWWFHVQDKSNAGTWSFGGRFAYGTMIFLSMWEIFVIYMQWDEHGLAVILRTYDKLRAIFCCASIEDRDVSDEPKPEEHNGLDYQEFDTVSDFSPRSVPIAPFDYQYTDQSVSAPETKEPEPSPTPPREKMNMARARSIPSQSFEVVSPDTKHRSKRKERRDRNNLDPKDFRRKGKREKQSVRKKINESGQIQIVKTGNKYLDEDYGQMEMSVSLSSRSETNRRVGKWKAPPRRKKPEEIEDTGPWKTQTQADRERKKRHSESERRDRERRDRRKRRHDEDELHYRKRDNPRGNQVIVIAGGKKGSSRSKSPRRR